MYSVLFIYLLGIFFGRFSYCFILSFFICLFFVRVYFSFFFMCCCLLIYSMFLLLIYGWLSTCLTIYNRLGSSPNLLYVSHSAKHGKMADFDPSGSQTPEPILMKLGTADYLWDSTPHDNFGWGSAAWVVWANNVTCHISEFL